MNKLISTVIFFGNGPVAAECLRKFVDSFGSAAIEAVVTKDRPVHHKDPAPVETLANELGIQVWFASSMSELDEVIVSKKPKSVVGIVIDYGVVIGKATIDYFEKGIINSHFSLLPEWRGADPITFSLLSGQEQTGVSIMLIDEGLDTGKLLAIAPLNIEKNDNSETLTSKLITLSNGMLTDVLPWYLEGKASAVKQELAYENIPGFSEPPKVSHSRKLTKEDGNLLFTKTAAELEREIRAYSVWPKSKTTIGGISCTITSAVTNSTELPSGEIRITDNKTLIIGCEAGSLEVLELQPAGKNKMPVSAFLNGYGHLL